MAILSSTGVSGFLSSAKATGKQILNKAGMVGKSGNVYPVYGE